MAGDRQRQRSDGARRSHRSEAESEFRRGMFRAIIDPRCGQTAIGSRSETDTRAGHRFDVP